MFRGTREVGALVDLLWARQASLWHACQLVDLRSYLGLGGVPSRQRLERARLPFTPFMTDSVDRSGGIWDRVFLNLEDIGRPFAQGWCAIPNVYGPIALQLAPEALREVDDVALCLRTAGRPGFDAARDSLDTIEKVDRVFRYPAAAGFPYASFTWYGDDLAAEFPGMDGAGTIEMNCGVRRTMIPGPSVISFEHLVVVWVDPIDVQGVALVELVCKAIEAAGLSVPVHERSICHERRRALGDITAIAGGGWVPLALLSSRHGVTDETRDWVTTVHGLGLDWLWDRYVRYLADGTLGSALDRLSPYLPGPIAVPRSRREAAPAYAATGPMTEPAFVVEMMDRLTPGSASVPEGSASEAA